MARRGRPIVIEWAADTRDYLRGMKNVERDTDDVADSLQDAAKDSDRFGRDFKDAMKDAERQADRSGRKIEQDFDRVPGELGEAGKEGSREFTSNLSEGLSSGNLEDVVQDTLGGLVGSMSGVLGGAVTVVAAGAALGLQKVKEMSEEVGSAVDGVRQYVAEAYDEIEGVGRSVDDTLATTGEWVAENAKLIDDNKELLDAAGISVAELTAAVLEGGEAQDLVNGKLDAYMDGRSAIDVLLSGESAQLNTIVKLINDSAAARETEGRQQQTTADAVNETRLQQGLLTVEAERTKERFDRIADSIRNLPDARIKGTIEWYNTGPGAAYVTRGNANYSPAHVAIQSMYNAGGSP